MTDEKMVEELAIIDGVEEYLGCVSYNKLRKRWQIRVPDPRAVVAIDNYLEDANCTKRIVRGMDGECLHRYATALEQIVFSKVLRRFDCRLFNPTVRQEAEAILKARGKWEEG